MCMGMFIRIRVCIYIFMYAYTTDTETRALFGVLGVFDSKEIVYVYINISFHMCTSLDAQSIYTYANTKERHRDNNCISLL